MRAEPQPNVDLLVSLQVENDALREEIARLRREFCGTDLVFPVAWSLTATEQRILAMLVTRSQSNKEALSTVLSLDQRGELPDPKVIEQHICRIRRKLRPLNLSIETSRYQGYRLSEGAREAIRRHAHRGRHV